MILNRRGSITVFLCIVLAAIIPLSCLLIDLARYNMAKKQAETALKITVESMLAAYDRQLREQYGLFALYPRDINAVEREISELLSQNLNVGASADGVSDIYGFNIHRVKAIPFYNLSEPDVLEQQVCEFMKYRAPVQVVQELYEKIKIMIGLMEEVEMVETKMELDMLMNDIRKSLVYLYYMLNEKCTDFNTLTDDPSITLKDNILANMKKNQISVSSYIENSNNEVDKVNRAQDGYIENYDDYKAAKTSKESTEGKLNRIKEKLNNKEDELNKVNNKLSEEADPKVISSLNRKKLTLEGDIEKLKEEKDTAQSSYNSAYERYSLMHAKIKGYEDDLNTGLTTALNNLDCAVNEINKAIDDINEFSAHIQLHISYHKDMIDIIEDIEPKMEDLNKESQTILEDAGKSDGIVADRVGGDLQEQLKYIQDDTYTDVLTQLNLNLQNLQTWQDSIFSGKNVLAEASATINDAIKEATAVKDKPNNDNNRFYKISISLGIENLETALSELGQTGRVFNIPTFNINPAPNETENKDFEKWFNERYHAISSEADEVSDDSQLKDVRKEAGYLANDIGERNDEANNEEETTKELDKSGLPSKVGPTSSQYSLQEIALLLNESVLSQAVSQVNIDNPLNDPIQGLNAVNENEKNFFNYEIERITKLFRQINEALKDGIEAMVESLYMNEYIVSSFKCASTVNNEIEHDIGWNRPLDNTFFDKGEIEYILFGSSKENSNINWSKTSIFAIRLAFNLLHIYTNPVKFSETLTWATAVAGWTIFGVPVVQNFLILLWAAAESYVDMSILFDSGSVPIIKTSSSWYLDLETLKNKALAELKDFASNQVEKVVDDSAEIVEETFENIIDTKIDSVFAPFEKTLSTVTNEAAENIEVIGDDLVDAVVGNISFINAQSFSNTLETALNNYVNSIADKVKNLGSDALLDFKEKFKQRIEDAIFESSLYKDLVDKVKSLGNELIDKGINSVTNHIEGVMGNSGKSIGGNITGRLIMMDYEDYLRLMLFMVSKHNKALRTADLIKVNMEKVSDANVSIDEYYTYIFVKAEVDFNSWFLPESIFKTDNNSGMISVEWSQGY